MQKLNIRIDKWLWYVRIFKTRSLASAACNAGKVKKDNQSVKPSREIASDEIYTITIDQLEKRIQVIDTPKQRIGARLVSLYYQDLTTQEEYERVKNLRLNTEQRPRGSGRPTKRERRQLDYLKRYYSNED